jgi:D-alanine-D-alanine ligase
MGGTSAERKISLRTGQAIHKALLKKNYKAYSIDVNRSLARTLIKKKIEVAFIALHGRWGEDGTVQGMLEIMQIPYTGSGVMASALALHKGMTKKILRYHRIPTANFQIVKAEEIKRADFHRKIKIPLPLVIKPVAEGSTIGTTIVKQKENLQDACKQAARFDQHILIERFIEGKEITTGILNGEALPLIEIVPKVGFYSFKSKYTPGNTEYIIPARIKKSVALKIQQLAIKSYHTIGCEGAARVDFMLNHKKSKPYILEINTIPGMTETSLLPMAAQYIGICFENLVERIILTARLKGV